MWTSRSHRFCSAHSHLWGCHKTTIRGKQLEDFLLKHNLSVLNDGSPTYLHPATGSLSAIDLSITDPSLFLDFSCILPLMALNSLYCADVPLSNYSLTSRYCLACTIWLHHVSLGRSLWPSLANYSDLNELYRLQICSWHTSNPVATRTR